MAWNMILQKKCSNHTLYSVTGGEISDQKLWLHSPWQHELSWNCPVPLCHFICYFMTIASMMEVSQLVGNVSKEINIPYILHRPLCFLKQAEHIAKICCFITTVLIHSVIMDVPDKSILKDNIQMADQREEIVNNWRKKKKKKRNLLIVQLKK